MSMLFILPKCYKRGTFIHAISTFARVIVVLMKLNYFQLLNDALMCSHFLLAGKILNNMHQIKI